MTGTSPVMTGSGDERPDQHPRPGARHADHPGGRRGRRDRLKPGRWRLGLRALSAIAARPGPHRPGRDDLRPGCRRGAGPALKEQRPGQMVDFSNRDNIQRWLNPQPREVSLTIAARAALRILPLLDPEQYSLVGPKYTSAI